MDPGIEAEDWDWVLKNSNGQFAQCMASEKIFSSYEAQRKVPLMFVLNVMCTLVGGYYNRNRQIKKYLEQFNDEYDAGDVVKPLNKVGSLINKLKLPDNSMWWNKANFFSLSVEVALAFINDVHFDAEATRAALVDFEADIPTDYNLAAREAVNNKNERILRGRYVRKILGLNSLSEPKA
jgi:hypothetical protein